MSRVIILVWTLSYYSVDYLNSVYPYRTYITVITQNLNPLFSLFLET